MFSHIMVGSNDIQRSKAFYNAILTVIGAEAPTERINDKGKARIIYAHKGIKNRIAKKFFYNSEIQINTKNYFQND